MTIGVTGASGHLGRQAAELVLDRVDPADVVLLSRTPDALAGLARRGAQVRHGDFEDPEALASSLEGVERLLIVSTDAISRGAEQQLAAVRAAVRAGVGHLVYTSMLRPEPGNPSLAAPAHAATERALHDSGVAWTVLRNGVYAEIALMAVASAVRRSQVETNVGYGRAAYVCRSDCAAAAAAVLTSDGHEGRTYDVTGSDVVGAGDVAALVGDLTGRFVEVIQVPDQPYTAVLSTFGGLARETAELVASFGRAQRERWWDTVSPSVEELTGRAPSSLRELVLAARSEIGLP